MSEQSSDDSSDSSFATIDDDQKYPPTSSSGLLSKYIIHLDVDYFYCQCEEILNPSLSSLPVAIGQKHIIVTCNYVARGMGVQKLQKKVDALLSCPTLTIIDGSDLEHYRDASRMIYTAFRNSLKNLHVGNTTKKGGMDEYFADLTASVLQVEEEQKNDRIGRDRSPSCNGHRCPPSAISEDVWIYGDDRDTKVVIREDQSGAMSTSVWKTDDGDAREWGCEKERNLCIRKLHIAARMAKKIQDEIKSSTNFSTTVGVSVSPMLAKIAADLKKPASCNVLFPWRSLSIIDCMPLRRIPDMGSKTLHSIMPALKQYNAVKDSEFWTCRDFLNVPRHAIQSCLEKDKDGRLYNLLINRCRGIDPLPIVDDEGGLNKTVSVENSFIRGSLTSMKEIKENIEILFVRIVRLIDKRKQCSPSPHEAYPKTIRVTARIVDKTIESGRRRPFRTLSKQVAFHNGKVFMEMNEISERIDILKRCAMPLLQILSDLRIDLNVTRLNLAAVSFADIKLVNKGAGNHPKGQKDVFSYFQSGPTISENFADESRNRDSKEDMNINSNFKNKESSNRHCVQHDMAKDPGKQHVVKNKNITPMKRQQNVTPTHANKKTKTKTCMPDIKQNQVACWDNQSGRKLSAGIDPTVFAALPTDLANEVLINQSFHQRITWKKKETGGIQQYFIKK